MIKNNLFSFATSELSQDAFICYLVSFALEDSIVHPVLNTCARNMLHLFVPEISAENITLVKIEQQFNLEKIGRIDILLTAYSDNGKYKIIVEDKTFTNEHDNQLIKYKKRISEVFPEYEVRGVFYKTGFQSNLEVAEKAGYNIITREKILKFLEPFIVKTNNQIIIDYYNYWKDFQDDVDLFSVKPIQDWNWKQIYGYFNYLKQSLNLIHDNYWKGYDYVANVAGGFYGFWFGKNEGHVTISNTIFEIYLQLEAVPWEKTTDLKICLKLSCESDPKQKDVRDARNKLLYEDDWRYRVNKYQFLKPRRVVGAKHMTIGIFDRKYADLRELGLAIQEALKEYERLLDDLRGIDG
ncbi:MAG: PD-(D/E)XK nuclease family protein [Succiniclasticum sp.]|uniref:PD-(D/E)XK nuclease family protein n=1 Tax=Succiniclasticum sp. TaxID=2775030 RepID=UPI002A912FB6|nr:PD-(D/E)XK nuclease family protein [Succiniclasticum sp.]MDY6291309.1 PD-(D/E)XK nuclease family protein [Succiniclasticum sp.]